MDTQTLDTFTNFVEFVKNVDKYKDVVAQFKQATQDHQDALNLLTQGKSLKAYEDSLASKQARLDFERQEFDKATQAQNAVLDQRAQDLNDREEDLNNRKSSLDSRETFLGKVTTGMNQKEVELSKKEQDLNVQIANNNQVAVDLAKRVALVLQAAA